MDNRPSDLTVLSRSSSVTRSAAGATVPRPSLHWRTRVLLPIVLLAAFLGMIGYAARRALWRGMDVQVVPVVVRNSQETGGGVLFQAPGWVEADPYTISVSALTDGVVKEILVLEGDPVRAGQPVARMVDDDARLALERAEAELQQRGTDVVAATAALAAAQQDWDFPIERTRAVEVAQGILDRAKAELVKLDADIRIEAAKLELAKEQLQREKSVTGAAIAEFQLVKSAREVQAQAAQVDSVLARKPMQEARIREIEADLKAAKENLRLRTVERKTLEEARAHLAAAEAAQVGSQAKRSEALLRLQRMTVYSLTSGVVLSRLINPGDKLTLNSDMRHSAHVVNLYDPERLQVRVDVPLGDASKLSIGLQTKIVVDVLPEKAFEGVVTRVVHEADIQKNTLQVKVAIRAPVPHLKPEMLARVAFLEPAGKVTGEPIQRVFVPRNLIVGAGVDTAVWIVNPDNGTAHRRGVKLGAEQVDGWVQVEAGLQSGDRVISGDIARLAEGATVNVVGEAP